MGAIAGRPICSAWAESGIFSTGPNSVRKLTMMMNPNASDPVIDEIREARHLISERCARDPARLVAYYTEFQEQYRDRLIATAKTAEHSDQPAA
jgi:hypothetical protein